MERSEARSDNYNSTNTLPQNRISNGSVNLIQTSFAPVELRYYLQLLAFHTDGRTNISLACINQSMATSNLSIIPNRLVNGDWEIENDSLIDMYVINNSLLKKKSLTLFLGKSGLFNINKQIGESYKILSSEIDPKSKTGFKAELTELGREILGIPDTVNDKIFLNMANVRLPLIASIPDTGQILATVKFEGKRYCAAYWDEKNQIMCDFSNPIQTNPDNGWLFKHTNSAYGSLLLNYILKFLLSK